MNKSFRSPFPHRYPRYPNISTYSGLTEPALPKRLKRIPSSTCVFGKFSDATDARICSLSPVVPFDLVHQLATFLQDPACRRQPTYLNLPPGITLDTLTAPGKALPPPPPPETMPENPPSAVPVTFLQAALTKDIPTPPPAPHSSPKMIASDPASIPLPPSPEIGRARGISNGTSSYFTQPLSSNVASELQEATNSTIDFPAIPFRLQPRLNDPRLQNMNGGLPSPAPLPRPSMGNLFLSSCPGKKGEHGLLRIFSC